MKALRNTCVDFDAYKTVAGEYDWVLIHPNLSALLKDEGYSSEQIRAILYRPSVSFNDFKQQGGIDISSFRNSTDVIYTYKGSVSVLDGDLKFTGKMTIKQVFNDDGGLYYLFNTTD